MDEERQTRVLRMSASRMRVVVGVGVLAALGALVLDVAVAGSFGFAARMLLLGLAACAFLMAWRLWSSGRVVLELVDGTLREAGAEGRILARVSDIRSVDRGAFAVKPSHGFLLKLHTPGTAAWVPGLWWRRGRYLGVGGLVPPHQTKLVAETIAMELASAAEAPASADGGAGKT